LRIVRAGWRLPIDPGQRLGARDALRDETTRPDRTTEAPQAALLTSVNTPERRLV